MDDDDETISINTSTLYDDTHLGFQRGDGSPLTLTIDRDDDGPYLKT
jgi:hypothetical protein